MRIAQAIQAAQQVQWNLPSEDNLLSEMPRYQPIVQTPHTQSAPVFPPIPVIDPEPPLDKFLRCPMPAVAGASPDNLRLFYRRGIPQRRIIPPNPL